MSIQSSAAGVTWNLSDLYQGIDDPAIGADLERLAARAKGFSQHRGALAGGTLTGSGLAAALTELEAIYEGIGLASAFAGLAFAGDTSDPARGALEVKVRETATAIRADVLFFELEWASLEDDAAAAHMAHAELARYRHFLETERAFKPYRRAEGEEQILDLKANTGSQAFARLFDETLARMRFTVELPAGPGEMSEEEVLSLLYDADRDTRKAGADALSRGLTDNGHLLTYVFNTLVADHATDDHIRAFPGPMAARNLANEITQDSVDALLATADGGADLVQDYYRIKKQLLGLDTLYDYDRYAPVGEAGHIPFAEAKEIVLDSFGAFSPKMADIARLFFDNGWIDAEVREGKRGGAFAHPVVPSKHPYILLNYMDRPRDVMTLAHELGHGIHQWLARDCGYFGGNTPLTTAETASVFGEMLVFSALKDRETDPEKSLALLCGKLEDTFATVFRQTVMTRFEQKLHAARRGEGELAPDRIDTLWMEANRPMFGDALTLRDDYASWWRYIPHFVHTPFYCYAYAYGELLVLSLYARYLEQGEAFVPRYLALLAAGGTDRPEKLLAPLGVDITAPDFWGGGVEIIRGWVRQAQEIVDPRG